MLDMSDRTKSILFQGFIGLALNLVFQREWEPVILGVSAFVVGALTLPYIITFMSDEKKDNRYK